MEKNEQNQNDERTATIIAADASGYAKCWADSLQLEPAASGLWKLQGEWRNTEQVRELFIADYNKDHADLRTQILRGSLKELRGNKVKGRRVNKSALRNAIDETLANKMRINLVETRNRLAFDPNTDPGMTLITEYASNLTTQNVEVATAVVANFIHVAKRRLFGLPDVYPVVPVIVGEQGVGKTMNVHRLLSPLCNYQLDLWDVSNLSDFRWLTKLTGKYVGEIDGVERFSLLSIDMLKNFITESSIRFLAHRTGEVINFTNNLTLICTSNYRLQNKPGTTRRFYEIIVNKEISQQISESISYTKLWQSVDENGPSPLLPYLPLLS